MTRQYHAGEWVALGDAFWEKQGGICELGDACLCGGAIEKPSEWLKRPASARRRQTRVSPTLDHEEGYTDALHVRGLCHHACNRKIHAIYFRWLHTKAVLEKAGLPVPLFELSIGRAGERKEAVVAPVPEPPTPQELSRMLGPGFRVVPNEGDSYSNRLHEQAAPLARRLVFKAVRNGTLADLPLKEGEKFQVFTRDRLVDWVAEKVGEETITIERYARRWFSDAGPMDEADTGVKALQQPSGLEGVYLRHPWMYYLGVDELLELWPEAGQRAVDEARRTSIIEKAQKEWEERERAKIQARFG